MQVVLALALLAAIGGLFWVAFARGTELCAVRFRAGTAELVRGRCPARLLDDVRDIARLEGLDGASLSVVSEGGSPRVTRAVALSPGQLQQLRNVVGRYSVSELRRGNARPR